jgi:hypothetical protein
VDAGISPIKSAIRPKPTDPKRGKARTYRMPSRQAHIEKHINHSHPIEFQDLDWDKAAAFGLTQDEVTILKYIADVEGQTPYYMKEVLSTKVAEDPAAMTFLTIWNYEEFFHSHAVMKFLGACGVDMNAERQVEVRTSAQFAAKAEAAFQWVLARVMPDTFNALYLSWAASQEYLTRLAYEEVASSTKNPVLRTLCLRIAKQERRHFAWYYNCAKEELAKSKWSQKVVRFIFKSFWSPVGVGVKSKEQALELVSSLFPGHRLSAAMDSVDNMITKLPGLDGLTFAQEYAESLVDAPAELAAVNS